MLGGAGIAQWLERRTRDRAPDLYLTNTQNHIQTHFSFFFFATANKCILLFVAVVFLRSVIVLVQLAEICWHCFGATC